jgi:diguanylate cyclase (GGDEF)-like protein
MAASPTIDPYASHDPNNTARFAGLVWAALGAAMLVVVPAASGGRPAGLAAGFVVGASGVVGGVAMIRGWTPPYLALLVFSYAGVAALAGLQLLYPGGHGDLLTELYLGIALQTGALHPPRRTAGVLAAIAGAGVLHQMHVGWTSTGVVSLVTHTGLFVMVALIANSLVVQLREQRAVARAEEAEAQRLASSDALTGLGNRRALMSDLDRVMGTREPTILALFDLDGFKAYNDGFGHPAGDSLLRSLGTKLAATLDGRGTAYRMGGDEFCVLIPATGGDEQVVRAANEALTEHGSGFTIGASCGTIQLPREAGTSEDALRGADRRMYAQKAGGRTSAGRQSADVLLRVLRERHPDLSDHLEGVTELSERVARQLVVADDEVGVLLQAASLHDVGKTAIPDAILDKPGPLNDAEWGFMCQHTVVGERILSAAPSLMRASLLVRWSHERFDGNGYPDRLSGDDIPLGARIICACDAFDAMISDRPYRSAISVDAALAELRHCSGAQFDPLVVDALCRAVTQPAAAHAA